MNTTQTRTRAAPRAEHAVKVYDGTGDTAVTALDDVTVEFPAGRFAAIMGPSGSGKSTLLHCLAGLGSGREYRWCTPTAAGPGCGSRPSSPDPGAGARHDPVGVGDHRRVRHAGGMILGTFLGWAVVRSSGGASLAVFAAPPLQLVLFLVLGAVTGILAGIRPARHAARQNTITAIASA